MSLQARESEKDNVLDLEYFRGVSGRRQQIQEYARPKPVTHHNQRIYQPTAETQELAKCRAELVNIHNTTGLIRQLHEKKLKYDIDTCYEEQRKRPLVSRAVSAFLRELKPPTKASKLRPPVTMVDVQNKAKTIGGRLLEGGENMDFTQELLYMPVFDGTHYFGANAGEGEFVLLRSKQNQVIAHIHYLVAPNKFGNPEVYKYFGDSLTDRKFSEYLPVRGQELERLDTVTTMFLDQLQLEWGLTVQPESNPSPTVEQQPVNRDY